MTSSAKKPTTTDGMPESSSMAGLTISRTRGPGQLRDVNGRAHGQRHGEQQADQRRLQTADDAAE